MSAEYVDGYTKQGVADLWQKHITEAHDPFRELSGGLYDRIKCWVKANGFGTDHHLIDVGCGQGVTSLVASEMGPLVTGVDISKPLIEIACRENAGNANVRFYVGDAADQQCDAHGVGG